MASPLVSEFSVGSPTVSVQYLVSPHMIRRDHRFWQRPDTFDPDRFPPGTPGGKSTIRVNSALIIRPVKRTAGRLRNLGMRIAAAVCGLAILAFGQTAAFAQSPAAAAPAPCQSTVFAGVAHEDDDLLFMSPDLLIDWGRGACLEIVYLTAGDAGSPGTGYVEQREQGIGRAYALVAGVPNDWPRQDRKHAGHTVRSFTLQVPAGMPGMRVTFLRLPDGLRDGSGTPLQGGQSLLKLEQRKISRITAMDRSASYDTNELTAMLSWFVADSHAKTVRTLDYRNVDHGTGPNSDHSDHEVAARYVKSAAASIPGPKPVVVGYMGYSISALPPNLALLPAQAKESVFRRYLSTTLCTEACADYTGPLWSSYQDWMVRQYPAN
ncbi:PIG-L family deacetylase [Streptomyces violascens]|uniref:PIG-L family deacetylase n=1 Tax=Streptomyces violascens TaxID=67381 RepID=UPI003693327D